ncbi:MAG: hypothetical protein MUF84_19475 [Anaerolineae bacterium]|jgi:hypothetical protein|nr:hypothetical protein [Anaerolineae bacterium]
MQVATATRARQLPLAGPRRPTLIERALDVIPLPYGWAALFIAAVLGPPGSLLVAYLETGSLQASLASYFHGYVPEHPWQQALVIALWSAFYAILFWTIRHARHSVLRAEPALASFLPESPAFDRAFGALSRLAPAIVIGLVIEAIFIGDYRVRILEAPGPYSAAYEALSGPPLYLLSGTALWVTASATWGLYRLGHEPLRLRPFYEDKAMGLRSMAALSLSLSKGTFSLLFIMGLMFLIGPVRTEYVLTVIVLLLLGLALFFLPLLGAHARMKREKLALQTYVKERWGMVLARNLDPASPVATDASALLTLEALERKVNSVHTWPFDLPILSKLGVMALSILLALLTQVIKNALNL